MTELPVTDPYPARFSEQLAVLRELMEQATREPRPTSKAATAAALERYRPRVYDAMIALGQQISNFEQTNPDAARLAAARDLVVSTLYELFPTNVILAVANRSPGQRIPYYELFELISRVTSGGGDLSALLISDYAITSVAGRSFQSRLALIRERLRSEIDWRLAAGYSPLQLFSLQYMNGSELLHLADDPARIAALRLTCVDASAAALRHAEQTWGQAFKRRVTFQMGEADRWLNGPACPRGEACIVYAVSLMEQVDSKTAVGILRGVRNLLREGGVFVMGSVTSSVPIAEQRVRGWVLGWGWQYRSEDEWRDLFAQADFNPEDLTVEYEPLRVGLVIRARRGA